ncbi:SusC/RagA family TonB-linked outer membrane protein [Xanthocytophaga flava]|uniref:SusC/RagA family TonB-linked outer membrane protein n=1 Tax=Xanthocytophaga flava TaxID=3048013 RepID=UPI0028D30AC2|nr:TonB-dependent receptor [Xanthocytophaga flavus]MDJ1472092.1 TonB-dependent receptor [Xanthocytophaga flavus]
MNIFLRFGLSFFVSVLLFCELSAQQTRTITGKVTQSEDNEAMPGVSVSVKGTTNGTLTDVSGNYSISNVPEKALLVFSFIGRQTMEVPIGNRATINVQMEPNVTELTQVVVTGYKTEQRRDIRGSIATITSDKFKDIPVVGMDQALQGQVAGVQVTQSSGTPGGGISVRVRGSTSISASNRPLFIVDGIPVEDGELGLRDFGGQKDNAFSTINPNDIESIEVLKDASAKAIYGSRAANGVVLVTTKRGKANTRTTIEADIQRGLIDVVRKPELLNAHELLELQREAVVNGGGDPDKLGLIPGVTDAVNTDWIDAVLRRALYQQYQISARGGNERTRFYTSINYRDEEGVQLNNKFIRFSGTINLDHKATDKLSFGNNLMVSRTRNDRVKGDNFLDGVYSGAIKSLPFDSPYNEQGQLLVPNSPGYPGFPNFNPVGQALLPRFQTFTTKIVAGLTAEYAFLPNLRFRTKLSTDYNGVTDDQFEPSTTAIGGFLPSVGGKGYGIYGSGNYITLNNTNLLTYNYVKGENHVHEFDILLGNEILKRTERTSQIVGRLFPRDEFTYITDPITGDPIASINEGSSFLVSNGLVSFFGEVKYKFKDKYLFGATARYDGSSRFGKGKRYGVFPSLSAAWRISAEDFMKEYTFLDDLRLKASYGFTGNERIGEFQFLTRFSGATYNGTTGLTPSALGNNNLQWEKTREINVGIEASLWSGRLGVTLDVYNNLTSKLLNTFPLPTTTGFSGFQGNIGSVSNKGIEFSVNGVVVDRAIKWRTNINISHNKNKVESLSDSLPLYRGYPASGTSSTNIIKVGEPLGTFWGLDFLGVDPATGDAIYRDNTGDGTISAEDAQVIGNAQPKLIGGITNTLSWKNLDLSVFFQFSYGNKILNFSNTTLLNSGQNIRNNQSRTALRRWRKPGDITDVPRYQYNPERNEDDNPNTMLSSRFVEDGSYIRLKNISLGYTLPKQLLTRFKVQSVRILLSATNLITLTRYSGPDPEVSTLDGSTAAQGLDLFTFPQVRNIMVGVTIGF